MFGLLVALVLLDARADEAGPLLDVPVTVF